MFILLDSLIPEDPSVGRIAASLFSSKPEDSYVTESFDDGDGNEVVTEQTPVAPELFKEAVGKKYLRRQPKPRGCKSLAYVLSPNGVEFLDSIRNDGFNPLH